MNIMCSQSFNNVAPLVGAWIEISSTTITTVLVLSLLSWERGLKFLKVYIFLILG